MISGLNSIENIRIYRPQSALINKTKNIAIASATQMTI
jgi:hypothetical protein